MERKMENNTIICDTKELIEEYYASDQLNFSFLKSFLSPDPHYMLRKQEKWNSSTRFWEENVHLNRGNVLDCKITTPHLFDDIYYISTIEKKPSDVVMSVFRKLFVYNSHNEELKDVAEQLILEACQDEGFWRTSYDEVTGKIVSGGRKPEWRVKEIIKQGSEYWKELSKSQGKVIISQEENDINEKCYYGIINQPELLDLIKYSSKQVRVNANWNGYECKGLIDIAETEDYIRVTDVKSTSEPLYRIPWLIKSKKWINQVVFYTELLRQVFPDKKVKLPQLLISSTDEPTNPQLVIISMRDYNIALKGAITDSLEIIDNKYFNNLDILRNEPILGIENAFKNYKKYLEGNKFKYTETKLW